ncbi:MAG: UvrD-helicase domain-containing protein [Nanoarchaeota archaeon]
MDEKEHLKILKALNEIPFQVGKNLLIDFLTGDTSNKSIFKNSLDNLKNFNSTKLDKQELRDCIDDLIKNKFIEVSGTLSNPFLKLLNITSKGQQELLKPSYSKNKKIEIKKSEINQNDLEKFEEFKDFLEGFNGAQKKAIIAEKEKIMCVAGAGSGKTKVLTKRIEFLIKHKNADPEKILAVTFTRKAKQEMKLRLLKLGINTNVETFNSFCEKVLNRFSDKIYGKPVRLMNYSDKFNAVKLALEKNNVSLHNAIDNYFSSAQKINKSVDKLISIFINDCFSVIEYFKLTNQELYDFSKDASKKDYRNATLIFEICKFIKGYMNLEGLRDYDDQIIDSIKFFENEGKDLIPKFEHILVDEYQDVNSLQVSLLKLINPNNLFCVGDPRQSIFGWRGSDINFILNFEREYPESDVIHMTENYRSAVTIVDFMNNSIKSMGLPDLHYQKSEMGKITLNKFDSETGEMEFIIKKIFESNTRRKDIFVLARTNRQLIELSKILRLSGIPHILKIDDENNSVMASEGEITLATIHSIKGLQAEEIFLIGCNTLNFPCKASDHPVLEMIKMQDYDKDQEEKRLFYVAISRAMYKLHLTYSGTCTYFINDDMMKIVE